MIELSSRLAQQEDIPAIVTLMKFSIAENMKAFLNAKEIVAAQETMGVDQSLITDQTYFLIETVDAGRTVLVGCGGWGKRKTLYGGDHTVGRDDSFSEPSVDAARIRAMYTHPGWIRKGVGTLLLELGEQAARDAGFKTIELGSTAAGEPFYLAHDYMEVSREILVGENGADNLVIKMIKDLKMRG
jgi:GNAT superfamily N-acetyltransferase